MSAILGLVAGYSKIKETENKIFIACVSVTLIIAITISIILFIEAASSNIDISLIVAAVFNIISSILITVLLIKHYNSISLFMLCFLLQTITIIIMSNSFKNNNNPSISLGIFVSMILYYIYIFIITNLVVYGLLNNLHNLSNLSISNLSNLSNELKLHNNNSNSD